MASNKDETGFITVFKQYKEEAKPILESIKAVSYSDTSKNEDERYDYKTKADKIGNLNLTDEQKDQQARSEYQRALRDIAAGRKYNLGRNFGSRGYDRIKE